MMKKFLGIILIIFAFIFSFSSIAKAGTTTANAPHWQKPVINVYIPQDEKAASMKRAFLKWQSVSDGKIKFKFVDKGPADIDILFAEKVNGSDGPIGSYSIKSQGKTITKAEITLATKSPQAKKYSNNLIYTTMLHEVGHALGLSDNSRKKGIMFMPVSENQDITKLDIRTLYNHNNWSYMDRRINK